MDHTPLIQAVHRRIWNLTNYPDRFTCSNARSRGVQRARGAGMMVLRWAGLSPRSIGEVYGGRHANTVRAILKGYEVDVEAVAMATRVWRQIDGINTPAPRDCVVAACDAMEVTPADLKSSSRKRPVVAARALASALLRQVAGMSFPEIARWLSENSGSHTKALDAFRRFKSHVEQGTVLQVGGESVTYGVLYDRLVVGLHTQGVAA